MFTKTTQDFRNRDYGQDVYVMDAPLAGHNGLYHCTYLLHLRGWNIVLQGLDPSGPGSSTFAVIGGTGPFRDATGDALFTDTATKTDMRITLSG